MLYRPDLGRAALACALHLCVEAPFVCRVLPCTSDATARDVLGGSA